jgi:hypothetical protein
MRTEVKKIENPQPGLLSPGRDNYGNPKRITARSTGTVNKGKDAKIHVSHNACFLLRGQARKNKYN